MTEPGSVVPTREPTKPTSTVIKRLFARSGNCCAFPRCQAALVQSETLIGEVCHIKAANPEGPRYDQRQTPAERHGYGNLIVLCPNHHTVIDDDEESDSVARLLKMKADHEQRGAPMTDEQAAHATQLYLNQSITSVGQSGGITANTIYLTIQNLEQRPPGKALAGGQPFSPKGPGTYAGSAGVSYFSSRSARYPLGGDIEEPRKADC
jgi:hypothetical protein